MAAAAGAGDAFRGAFEGSISGSQFEIDRRPYHKNCNCAFHGIGASKCPNHKSTKVSYAIRRSWSEGSLALYAASGSSPSPSPSPSPSRDLLPSKIPPSLPNHHHQHHRRQYVDEDAIFPTKI